MPNTNQARLLAIVSVAEEKKVICQQPGCGHGVYAAIHVVEDSGRILVLGSTCFAKRYEGYKGAPELAGTGWGNGEPLTDQQREMLANNTRELLAQFTALKDAEVIRLQQQAAARMRQIEESEARRQALARQGQIQRHAQRLQAMENHAAIQAGVQPRDMSHNRIAPSERRPWPWQHPRNTSVAVIRSPQGQHWVRVQAADGSQKLAPWPMFDGWETALPAICGEPDAHIQAYSTPNIAEALQTLRGIGYSAPMVGTWPEVMPRNYRR